MNITCPKCNSNKVISVDNEPLHHPDKYKEDEMNYDNEVYVKFECFGCQEEFKEVFDMVHRPKPPKVEQRYAVDITRTSIQTQVIYVMAKDEREAKKLALGIAGDFLYKEIDANYSVEHVQLEPLK